MYIVMLGKPGSGKGTVGKMLSESLGIAHISSGEIFRNYIKKAGEIGTIIEEYVNKGMLVPDELTIKLVEKRLDEDDCKIHRHEKIVGEIGIAEEPDCYILYMKEEKDRRVVAKYQFDKRKIEDNRKE